MWREIFGSRISRKEYGEYYTEYGDYLNLVFTWKGILSICLIRNVDFIRE